MRNILYPQVKAFAMRNELNLDKVKLYAMQRWICNVKEMVTKADKRPKNDTRRCCE